MRAFALSKTEAGIRELAAQRGYGYREASEERAPEAPVLDLPEGARHRLAWTTDEKRLLAMMIAEHKTVEQIAESFGRTREAIAVWIRNDPEMRAVRLRSVKSNVIDFRGPREIRRIIDLVARMHGESFATVMSEVRFRGPAMARQAAICAVKEAKPGMSLAQIGRVFRRDPKTVWFSLKVRGMTATLIAQDKGAE